MPLVGFLNSLGSNDRPTCGTRFIVAWARTRIAGLVSRACPQFSKMTAAAN